MGDGQRSAHEMEERPPTVGALDGVLRAFEEAVAWPSTRG